MDLSAEKWKIIQSILDEILDQPKENHLTLLKKHCKGDYQLFLEIEELLKSEEKLPTLFESPALNLKAISELGNRNQNKPQSIDPLDQNFSIGPYIVREIIGIGGMGTVYRAERVTDFEQQVAIKLLTHNTDQSQVISRFKLEQQILANLKHPHIAQLYDGGVTTDGVPYFVMEYVQGEHIDKYCNRLKLGVNERLTLLLQVAEALNYAHNKLIVHRDIKPSNILVNEEGQVKLLDFGIAKIISDDCTLLTTQTSGQALTPGYAAPEQLLNHPISVETDVYLLGLVFYKVLTGVPAFKDQSTSFLEMAQKICEQEPTLPSKLMMQLSQEETQKVIEMYSIDCKQLHKILAGDLDSILLKMLKKVPGERYNSMLELKFDILAYFEHRPIIAQKLTFIYQSKKFLRRHWRLLATVTLFFVFLLVYAFTVTIQSHRIQFAFEVNQKEKIKAQQATDFLVSLFETADPNVSSGKSLSPKDLLAQGYRNISTELRDAPDIQARLLSKLGKIYFSLGYYSESVELHEKVLAMQRQLNKNNTIDLATGDAFSNAKKAENKEELAYSLSQLGIAYSQTKRITAAQLLLNESLALYAELTEENHYPKSGRYAEALSINAEILRLSGEMKQSRMFFVEAIALLRKIDNASPSELAVALNGLANVEYALGAFDSAIENVSNAIEQHEKTLGKKHSYLSVYYTNYGAMLADLERFDQALVYCQKALNIQQEILPSDHPYLSSTFRVMGTVSYHQGHLNEAVKYFQLALDITESNANSNHYMTPYIHIMLSEVLRDQAKYDETKFHIQSAKALFEKFSASEQYLGENLMLTAYISLAENEQLQAKNHFEQALLYLTPESVNYTKAQVGLAFIHNINGEYVQVELITRDVLAVREKRFPDSHSLIAEARALLAISLVNQNNGNKESVTLIAKARPILIENPLFKIGYRKQLLDWLSVIDR